MNRAQLAAMEAARQDAEDEFFEFEASPDSDTPKARQAFRGGFERAWRAMLENANAAAEDWKRRYEGMAILHANKVRMIESGELIYASNLPLNDGDQRTA